MYMHVLEEADISTNYMHFNMYINDCKLIVLGIDPV